MDPMKSRTTNRRTCRVGAFLVLVLCFARGFAAAADKLVGIHSARVMSQSLPWMAQEAGLFKKYNLDFNLVFISSSSIVTAALLGGDAEMTVTGRIGGNSHYFTVQALRKFNMDPSRDVSFMQTGGDPETFAALVSGSLEVANLTPPTDALAISRGYHYVIYGPDLKIPYAATAFVTKRSVIAKRSQVIGNFMRAMAETAKIMHTDREFVYKVLGKYLRVTDRKVLDSAYNAEIKVLEPRLVIKEESLQAIIDELSQTDARAKKIKPAELIDTRYLDEMEKGGFFDQLWAKK